MSLLYFILDCSFRQHYGRHCPRRWHPRVSSRCRRVFSCFTGWSDLEIHVAYVSNTPSCPTLSETSICSFFILSWIVVLGNITADTVLVVGTHAYLRDAGGCLAVLRGGRTLRFTSRMSQIRLLAQHFEIFSQEDGHVEESSAWEKRPRYQRQSKSPAAFEQPPRNQPSPVPTQMEGVGGSAHLTLSNAAGRQPHLSFLEQQQQAQAQAQSSAMVEGGAPFTSPSFVGGASFDRMRFHELDEADMSAAAPINPFRCSGSQAGVAQPTNGVVKEGSTVWGSGQFQAVPAPSLR